MVIFEEKEIIILERKEIEALHNLLFGLLVGPPSEFEFPDGKYRDQLHDIRIGLENSLPRRRTSYTFGDN